LKKMNKKWIALCSTAVVAVYTAGFYTTDTQAVNSQPIQHIAKNLQTTSQAVNGTKGSSNQVNNFIKMEPLLVLE